MSLSSDSQAMVDLIVGKKIEKVIFNEEGNLEYIELEGGVQIVPLAYPMVNIRLKGTDPTTLLEDDAPPADNIVPYRRDGRE